MFGVFPILDGVFKMMHSKKQLAVALSRLQSFEKPSPFLEQYPTDSEIAAEILWFAYQNRDIEKKKLSDFGCGTGILGIGALMLGAGFVYFADVDDRPLKRLKENLSLMELHNNYEIECRDIRTFSGEVDVVLQNPPFGVKNEHADRLFLEKAFSCAKVVYSFHKIESAKFIDALAKDNSFKATHFFKFDFPLKKTMAFHEKRMEKISVGCWRMEKAAGELRHNR